WPLGSKPNVKQERAASRAGRACAATDSSRLAALLPPAAARAAALDDLERAPIGQVLDQAPGDASFRHGRGEGVLLAPPPRPALFSPPLLRRAPQPIGRQLQAGIHVGLALLDLDGARAGHAERQVALVRLAAISVVVADLDAQLGSLAVTEPTQRPDDVLLS